jgi:nucleoside-diphosphate-sugar epimerase
MAPNAEDVHLPMNIGNPHELTVLEIAEKIIERSGSNSRILFEPMPEDDPNVRRPDIFRANRLLDWSPKISLEASLKRTIDYFCLKPKNTE